MDNGQVSKDNNILTNFLSYFCHLKYCNMLGLGFSGSTYALYWVLGLVGLVWRSLCCVSNLQVLTHFQSI